MKALRNTVHYTVLRRAFCRSVCPSVCASVRLSVKRVDFAKTTETSCAHNLTPHGKNVYPSFLTRRMVGGRLPLVPKILDQTDPVFQHERQFSIDIR